MDQINSFYPWQQRPLNQSGVRRLKIADADALPWLLGIGPVPQKEFTFYEFIFPSDLSCVASFQRQQSETGSVFWAQNIAFTLPHLADDLTQWAHENRNTLWSAIAEDYNGNTRFFGGVPSGLEMGYQASTGGSPRDANPMVFSFSSQQLFPFMLLADYSDQVLFPNGAGFSYGFSTGFNS